MSKYMSLEQTIRKLGAKGVSQPLEKDMNDQIHAGSYTSKHFEVSAPAQKMFASLPKDVNPDTAEKSAQLHDKLFAIHKKTKASERSTDADVSAAQELHDKIMSLAKEMGNEKDHGHVKDSLDYIKKMVDKESNVKDDIKPEDVAKRFGTPEKDYQTDVKNDADIDNMAKFHISRDKKAQRKLKIIDDQYNPGVDEMDHIENVSPSFLEALKKVQENAMELEEKKKMSKADIAALKEPKGKFDEKDLAALRAGEHKKKVDKDGKAFMHVGVDEDYDSDAAKEKNYTDAIIHVRKKENLKRKTFINKSKMLNKKAVTGMDEETETLDEAQFIVIQKGMEKKRIRNNPVDIMQARKDGWAIQEEAEQIDELKKSALMAVRNRAAGRMMDSDMKDEKATKVEKQASDRLKKIKDKEDDERSKREYKAWKEETEQVDEGSEMQNLAKSQAKAVIKREVQQKKAMFAKKDATDKAKFAKQLAKEEFVAKAIAILGEEFADWSYEQLAEEIVKRGRGRPRKNPLPDPNAPKRGRGRPRKDAGSSPSSAAKPEEAGDREHIVMGLRKAISLRGEHGVKFADGSVHKIPAEHAQKALKMHDSLSKPSEKMVFQRKLGASHSSFKKALEDKNPGSEETKKTGITLAKRAD